MYADYCGDKTIVVIYDANNTKPNGHSNVHNQNRAEQYKRDADDDDTVILVPIYNMNDFIKEWNKLNYQNYSGGIDELIILMHGDSDLLAINGDYMGESEVYSFDQLHDARCVKETLLLSCFGGSYKNGKSVGQRLANKTFSDVTACTAPVTFMTVLGMTFHYVKGFGLIGGGRWVWFVPYFGEPSGCGGGEWRRERA